MQSSAKCTMKWTREDLPLHTPSVLPAMPSSAGGDGLAKSPSCRETEGFAYVKIQYTILSWKYLANETELKGTFCSRLSRRYPLSSLTLIKNPTWLHTLPFIKLVSNTLCTPTLLPLLLPLLKHTLLLKYCNMTDEDVRIFFLKRGNLANLAGTLIQNNLQLCR